MSTGPISAFYRSRAWKQCRDGFLRSRGGLCERCLARGIINAGSPDVPLQVHHKVHLTEENVSDPAVALNWDNLVLLCATCHAEMHSSASAKRWIVDEFGHVEAASPPCPATN